MQPATNLEHELELTKLVTVLAAFYPSIEVKDATIKAYVLRLQDLPLAHVATAIEQCSTESKFFPSLAEIRDKALELMHPQSMTALEAWGEVKEQMSRTGFYRSPTFSDPNITRAVECLGWKTLCSSENEPADRAHFARVYESLVQREAADRRLLPAARQLRELLEQASDQKQLIDGRRR